MALVAAPEGLTHVGRERPAVAQALGQVGVGGEETPERDEVGVAFGEDRFCAVAIEAAGGDDRSTALTRTPAAAVSSAADLVKPSTACLLAA